MGPLKASAVSTAVQSLDTCGAAMRSVGYTPRQAAFLARVLLHGGYFVRRQYTTWIGAAHGLATVRFLDRLAARRHAQRLPFGRHGQVYHLCARALYEACGLRGRRWGREASWPRVMEAVTTLDFVIAHGDAVFVVKDEDKARVLANAGVELDAWPVSRRCRRPHAAAAVTAATFDHRAWYVEPSDPRLSLLYVESGTRLATFRMFLRAHLGVLRGVRSAVAYVSPSTATAALRDLFAHVVVRQPDHPATRDADFVHYCRVRRAAEANELASISVADINRYRALRPIFSSRHYEDLFQRWVPNADASHLSPNPGGESNIDCVLRVYQTALVPRRIVSEPTEK